MDKLVENIEGNEENLDFATVKFARYAIKSSNIVDLALLEISGM